ncbi:MAG: TolB family protein, partial [Thermoanaerobaculia bacterium]
MRPLFMACAVFFAAVSTHAQAPSADWQTIATPHFRVHYPKEYAAWSERAASRLESIHAAVSREVGFTSPTVIDVLVVNPIAQANGSAWPLLDTPRIVFFTEPPGPGDTIGAYTNWIDLLAVHEVAHVMHMLRPSRNPVQRIIESILPAGRLTLGAPRWVLEGYATVIEGRLTGAGRPSSTARALILRQWAAHGRLPTYDQLDSEERYLGGAMAYLAGSAFLEWLEARTGPESLRNVWTRMTAYERRSFEVAFAGVFGESPERLYGDFAAELTASAVAVKRAAPGADGELWQETSRSASDPAVSPDGKRLVIVQRPRREPAKLVVWSTGPAEEEEKRYAEKLAKIRERDPEDVLPVRSKPLTREPAHTWTATDGGDVSGPRWTADGRSILFEHRQPDAEGFLHHDLFLWTPDEGKARRVTRLSDVSQADPMPGAQSDGALRNRHGYSQLVTVDLGSGDVRPLTERSLDIVHSHPRVDRSGSRVAYVANRDGKWTLIIRDLGTGAESTIEPAAGEAFASPEWTEQGELIATVSSGGFAELYRISPGGQRVGFTRTMGGALQPAPSPDGRVFFMSLEPEGFELRVITPAEIAARPPLDPSLVPAIPPRPPAAT